MKINEIINKVIKYQETHRDDLFEEIIKDFDLCINKVVDQVDDYYKEDLRQEILIGIYQAIVKFKINIYSTTKFENNEFIEFKNKFFNGVKKLDRDIILEYQLFNIENQFKKYIKTTCQNIQKNFYKKMIKNHENQTSLNEKVSDDIELLDLIQYPVIKTYENVIDELTTKDRIFLENFIEGGIVKKNKDVAKKLGISSQAVSAKKIKIKEKIRKNAKLKEEKICLF